MSGSSRNNFYNDNDDLRFYIEKYINWKPLIELTEFDFQTQDGFKDTEEAVDTYTRILEMIGEFSANEIAPFAAEIDKQHPHLENGKVHFPEILQNIFDQIKALELHGMCLPRPLGGMNCPFALFMIANELIARADVSVCAHHGFHCGMAMAALLFSIMEGTTEFDYENFDIKETRFREMIDEIVAGEAWGSMDITEPEAGSDMASLTSRAGQDEDGAWRLTGQKIFITSGHAKYHFVIARTEEIKDKEDAFSGLDGLSMFLVPCFEDKDGERVHYADFIGVEDKLGHHGSATVAISFDDTPAHLIGERGEGFKYMLMLMNNARVGVGFESIGICEAALRMARDYAAERFSMGKMIDKHEMIADYLDEMQTDLQGIRALAVAGAFHEEMTQKLTLKQKFMAPEDNNEQKKIERDLKFHQALSRRLTPLVKYLGSEKAVEIARRCIQIHGGYGYTTEYGVEKLLRDAMVLPIYEGTSQIQALMVMKDSLIGVLKDPKAFFLDTIKAFSLRLTSRSRNERRVAKLQLLSARTKRYLMSRMAWTKFKEMLGEPIGRWGAAFANWDPKKDFALAMLHAERLIRIQIDVAVCELFLDQAKKFPEREEVLESYLERAETRCKHLYNEITTTGKRLLKKLANAEEGSAEGADIKSDKEKEKVPETSKA